MLTAAQSGGVSPARLGESADGGRMRSTLSSSSAGVPTPSRLDVVIHSAPSASRTTVRSRPYSPAEELLGVPDDRAGLVERSARGSARRPARRGRRTAGGRAAAQAALLGRDRRPPAAGPPCEPTSPPSGTALSSSGRVVGRVEACPRRPGTARSTSRCPRLNTAPPPTGAAEDVDAQHLARPGDAGSRGQRRVAGVPGADEQVAVGAEHQPAAVVHLAAGDAGEHRVRACRRSGSGRPGCRSRSTRRRRAARPRGRWATAPARAARRPRRCRSPARSSARGPGSGRGRPAGAGRCRARRRRRCRRAGATSPVGTASPEATTLGSPAVLARTRARPGSPGDGRALPTTAVPTSRRGALGQRPERAGRARSRRCRSRPARRPASRTASEPGRPARRSAASPAHSTCGAGPWAARPPRVGARDPPEPGPGRDRCTCWCPSRAIGAARRGALARACGPTGSTPPTARRPGRRPGPRSGSRARARAASRTTASSTALPAAAAGPAAQRGRGAVRRPAARRGRSCATPGARTRRATAEWAVAATLAAQRGIPFFVREQDAGRWSFTHPLLAGRRAGADRRRRRHRPRRIGRMLAGFDVELTYVGAHRAGRRAGARRAAASCCRTPTSSSSSSRSPPETTRHGRRRASSPRCPTARCWSTPPAGVVVDTDALLAELTAGRLRAALDVTDPEPLPAGHPLWSAPGLLLTPHVGGAVPETRRARGRRRRRADRPRRWPASRWRTWSTATEVRGRLRPTDRGHARAGLLLHLDRAVGSGAEGAEGRERASSRPCRTSSSRSSRRRRRGAIAPRRRTHYAQSGVDEYWIVDAPKRRVLVFFREGDAFAAPETTTAGAVRSRVLPDLRITIDEIFGDLDPRATTARSALLRALCARPSAGSEAPRGLGAWSEGRVAPRSRGRASAERSERGE